MRKLLLALVLPVVILAIPQTASAQISFPLRFKNSGVIVTPTRPFANCTGGGVTCVDDPANNATDITVAAGAGGTLNNIYNNGTVAADQTMNIAAAKGGSIIVQAPAVAIGSLFQVKANGGGTLVNVSDNSDMQFITPVASALTLTGKATSTWSIVKQPTANATGFGLDIIGSDGGNSDGTAPGGLGGRVRLIGGNGGTGSGAQPGGPGRGVLLVSGAGGDGTAAAASGNGGLILIVSGAAGVNNGGGAGNAGNIQLDSAAAVAPGTAGSIIIAPNFATSVGIGRSGITTTVTGALTQLTGSVSLTGNAASSFTTSAGALTLTSFSSAIWSTSGAASSLTLNAGGGGGLFLQDNNVTLMDIEGTSSNTIVVYSNKALRLASAASLQAPNPLIVATAPTISSGFGTGASVTVANGTAAFRVGVGTTSATTGVIALPTVSNGWNCYCTDISTNSTAVSQCKQTASANNSATIGNFSDISVPTAWADNDVLAVSCFAF